MLSPLDKLEFCSVILPKSNHWQLLKSFPKATKHFPFSTVTESHVFTLSILLSNEIFVLLLELWISITTAKEFDFISIGEKTALKEAFEVLKEKNNFSRDEILEKLSNLDGIYVPKFKKEKVFINFV